MTRLLASQVWESHCWATPTAEAPSLQNQEATGFSASPVWDTCFWLLQSHRNGFNKSILNIYSFYRFCSSSQPWLIHCIRSFLAMSQNIWSKHLKRGKIYLGLGFQKAASIVAWPYILEQNITAVGSCGSCHLMVESKQREKRKAERAQGQDTPKNSLPPARSHLLKSPKPPKIVISAVLKMWACEGHLTLKTIQFLIRCKCYVSCVTVLFRKKGQERSLHTFIEI